MDEKNIYLILDYRLPDSVDPETVEIAYNSRENTQKDDIKLPMVTYYLTDDIAWEDLKAADQDTWATLTGQTTAHPRLLREVGKQLNRIGRVNGSSGSSGGSETRATIQPPIHSPISLISPETRTAPTSPPSP